MKQYEQLGEFIPLNKRTKRANQPEYKAIPGKNFIVLTEEELLDLMQESIEHSHPTLPRIKAIALLNAKLANS